jgi:hypothetical protein
MLADGSEVNVNRGCLTTLFPAGAEFGEVLVLSTLTWTTAYQWSLPSYPVGVGLLGAGAELAVFPDTLAPAVRLTLYAAPARELPVTLQVMMTGIQLCWARLLSPYMPRNHSSVPGC